MIIDVHAHLGEDRVFDEVFTEEDQWEKINQFGVDYTILQPALVHTIEEVRKQHDSIASLCNKFPDKFGGMANPNPHLEDHIYEQEVRRCIEELGFKGIKIHTFAHGVNPAGRDGRKVFEFARKLKVPVMIHTGAGIPFANPSNLLFVAKEFSDVSIILAHCGMTIMANETYQVMKVNENVYADITWTGSNILVPWVKELGAHRFMFGTDHANNCGTELSKIRTIGLTEAEQEEILYKAAQKVYKLNIR